MVDIFKAFELKGKKVILTPLIESHAEELIKAASDGKLWQMYYTAVPSQSSIVGYIKNALGDFQEGTALPFAVVDRNTKEIIGTTRYCNIASENRRLEIGYTWY